MIARKWIISGVLSLWAAGLCTAARSGAGPVRDSAPAAQFPGADALILREDVMVEYQADGGSVQSVHRQVRILTEKGRQDYAAESYTYHRAHGSVEIEQAQVIRPDGTVAPVPEGAITDRPLDDRQPVEIGGDFRRKTIAYPDLGLQDTVETRVVFRSHGQVKGHYSDFFLFQVQNPILYKRVEIRGPRSRPLHSAVKGGTLESETVPGEGGTVIRRWTGRNVPGIVLEPGMVPLPGVALRLLVSTLPDWRELSRLGHAQGAGKADTSEALRQKVAELTGGLADTHSKIMTIFRFVSTEIGYMDASMSTGGFLEPHSATSTLERKAGIGRDKSVLMIAMLREIGVEGTEALVDVSHDTDPEVPSIYFGRALCAVKLPDGRSVLLDPTLEFSTSLGETSVGDRRALLLTAAGADLARQPHSPSSRSQGRVQAVSRLGADLGLQSRVHIEGTGYYDFLLRRYARQEQNVRYAQLWQQLAAALHPGSRIRGLELGSPADLGAPYAISFDLTGPAYALETGRFVLFKMPLSTNFFEVYALGLPRLAEPGSRKYPLSLFSTVSALQEERLSLPDGFQVLAVPDPVEFESGPLRLSLSTRQEGRELVFRSEYRCETSILDPGDYPAFRHLLQVWGRSRRSMVVLERTAGEGGRP